MADIGGTYASNRNYQPHFNYTVSYSQTGRDSSSATYRFTVGYSRLNGGYAYDIRINWNINGASGSKELKSTANNSSGSTSFDVRVSTDSGGGIINGCRIYSSSNTDGTHYQNGFDTGNRSVNKSSWNTAPTWTSDDGNINGIKNHTIIAENTGNVTVNSPSVTDRENTVYLYVYRYVNGVQNAKIADGITGRSVVDNINGFGQGAQIKYLFQAKDGYNLWAGDRWSWTYTKNTLTPANASVNKTIGYDDSNFEINLSGASNSDGSGGFNYRLTSSNIPIHNNSGSASKWVIAIHKGGTAPSGPYINFEDLKNVFRGSSFNGRFIIDVLTSNSRGTTKSTAVSVGVDIRTTPNNASVSSVGGGVAVAGGSYYVPSIKGLTLNWNAGSDKLGGAVTYDIQFAKSGENYVNIATGLTGLSCSYNPSTVGSATNCTFRIITRTTYGYTNTITSSTLVLHYYNAPRVSLGDMNRSSTEVTLPVTTSTDTSIPAVAINSRKYTGKSGTASTFAGSPYTIVETGLTDTQTYTIRIDVSDNSGLGGSTVTVNKTVGTYVPIVSIRKYGLGINDFANSTYKVKVGGSVYASGILRVKNVETFEELGANVQLNDLKRVGEYVQNANANTSAALNYPENQAGHLTVTQGAGYQQRYHVYNTSRIYVRAQYNTGGWCAWAKLYNTTDKPSANDIGALPSNGKAIKSSRLEFGNGSDNGDNNFIGYGGADGIGWDGYNMKIRSWWGIGFPSYDNINRLVIDTRTGDIWTKGVLHSNADVRIGGVSIVATGSNNNGVYTKYSDGTLICQGRITFGNSPFQTKSAEATWTGPDTAWNRTFPHAFTQVPAITCSAASTGYLNCCAAGASTTGFVLRIWSSYQSTHSGCFASYMAVGRWK